ncbi:hypothetical protein [Malikia spinosa]|jgi:hypothetical protein|uniref:hypothetical protein n=1 Tax=Malikia spinosa TaxID=86180 RepID=UPI003FA2D72C
MTYPQRYPQKFWATPEIREKSMTWQILESRRTHPGRTLHAEANPAESKGRIDPPLQQSPATLMTPTSGSIMF